MMKKTISLILCGLMALLCILPASAYAQEPLKVVTTIFPPYDFVREIAGDRVELSMLLKPGSESHSFEPSPQDIIKIQSSDVFIYAGGEGDAWIERILESIDATGITMLAMTDMVQTVEEEIVEGMEHAHEEDEHSEAFDPDKVYDRALAEWTGAWKSLAPYLTSGTLDEYIRDKALEEEITFDAYLEKRQDAWRTDGFDTFMIAGDKAYVDTGDKTYSGSYQYEGYAILEKETGTSVWYQYALEGEAEGMPRYLAFNDHGYGTPPEGEDHADEHDHEHDHGVAHTHLRYGDESLEALVAAEGWSPFFVEASATDEQIVDTLTGHGTHSHDHEHELDEHATVLL